MPEITPETANRSARDFYDKALAALERNNLDYAIELFRQALVSEPNFIKARQYLRAAQMKHASSSSFRRMLSAAKATGQLAKGKMAMAKNPAEAMNIAEEILTGDPKQQQALVLLAEAADAGNYPETTIQTLEFYLKLNARDTRAMHWLGRSYCLVQAFDSARDIYERILEIHPADFAAQKALKDVTARGAMHGGGWDQAQSYRDVMKDKDEAVALEQQGRVVRAEDMLENLIKENLQRLAAEPDNPVIRRELGKLYGQKGDFKTALEYLEKIFQTEGGADPGLEREIAEIKSKRIAAHVAAKQKQLAANPANAAALENEIAALQKELDALRLSDAERLVERYPNDMMYRFDLAVLYMRNGNVQNAIEQFQRSVGQPQKRIASLNYLGQCFQLMGLHDLAIEQYAKAIEEQPIMDNLKKELIYNLGSAYEQMGDKEKAVAEFKKIAAVDYGYRDVKDRISRRQPPPSPPAAGPTAGA